MAKATSSQEPRKQAAESWTAVAGALRVSRETIYNWRRFPNAPKEPDVEAWQAWKEENKGEGADREIAEVKRLVALEQLRKLKRENEIGEGKTVPVDEVIAALREATAKWDSVLTSKLDQEAPARLVGKEIAELRAELSAIHDELREAMGRELAYHVEKK
jgi:hypothetical protein